MELLLPSSIPPMAAAIAAALLFLYFLLRHSKSNLKVAAVAVPEAAGAWPVIGHLPLLAGSRLPHIVLGEMADWYGPIFNIKLGVHRTLVVSSSEMAKECLTTNDRVFASRPRTLAKDLMSYNHAMMVFSPYGSYWRQIRKITKLDFFSNRGLQMYWQLHESEARASIREIYRTWVDNGSNKVSMEMKRWVGNIILRVNIKMVMGKYYAAAGKCPDDDDGRFMDLVVKDYMQLLGVFVVSDALPFLRWLDLGGYGKEMKKTAQELDSVLEEWMKPQKQKRGSGEEEKSWGGFMNNMASALDREVLMDVPPNLNNDTINKATCLNLLIGAVDTTIVTFVWALSLLLNNPNTLKKVHEELDTQVGRERQVMKSDMKDLVYLQAVVKETLRLYPPGPLSMPHEATEDCVVGGYHVAAGTRLLVNLWKIQRDPRVWSESDEFQPERFLTTHKEVDVKGHHFELIPFSSGRRMCPGIDFALEGLHCTLANLLHGFEFGTPSDEAVDMTGSFGLTNHKAMPLEVLLSPRLPPYLYA